MIAPRRLDRGLARLGAGIAEEHLVGERHGDQPLGQPLLALDAVEVGGVPELAGLLGQRRDEACGCACPSTLTAMPEAKSR